jgi:hypothetical protein
MCGPSSQQQSLENSQSSFMTTLMSNYNQNFANQQAVLANLNQTLGPIVAKGPNQTGFSPQELAAENTTAIDTTAGNYKNAATALNNELSSRNDSGNLPESGVDQVLKERLASSAAGQLSQEELGITEANYATGRSNFQNAESGELALAGEYNPVPTGSLANQSNQQAFGEATQINQEQNQEEADIAGGIESLATGGISGVAAGLGNLDSTGSSSRGEQVGNFFQGAFG